MARLKKILNNLFVLIWVVVFPVVICIMLLPMLIWDGVNGVDTLLGWWGLFELE